MGMAMGKLRYILILLLFIIASPASVVNAQDQNAQDQHLPKFFTMLQDIPLMSGLTELEDQALYFDKPEGRIIESSALMQGVTKEQVLYFYQINLPQFGWGRVSENQFFRNGEFLEINFKEGLMKIMIKPTL